MKHRPDSRGLLYFSIAVLSVWAGELANLGFPVGVQPTDDTETLALLASVGYTP